MGAERVERDALDEGVDALVIDTLNALLELEMAGVVRYTHYSFMVFGFKQGVYNRLMIFPYRSNRFF